MRRRSEDSIYTYTILSNCEGGAVLFDNERVGVVSGGQCVVGLAKKDSFVVRIVGGLPPDETYTVNSFDQYTTDRDEYSVSDFSPMVNSSNADGNNRNFIFTIGAIGGSDIIKKTHIQSVWIRDITEVYLRKYDSPFPKTIYPEEYVELNYEYSSQIQDTIIGEPRLLRETSSSPVTVINYQPLRLTFEPGGRSWGATWLISPTSIDFSNSWVTGSSTFYAGPTLATWVEMTSLMDTYIKCIIDDYIYDNNVKIPIYKEFTCTTRFNG